jgi:hypothetical protein
MSRSTDNRLRCRCYDGSCDCSQGGQPVPAPRGLGVVTAAGSPNGLRPPQMAPDARARLAAMVAYEIYCEEAGHDRRTYMPATARATVDTYAALTAAGEVEAASRVLDTLRGRAARDRRARGQATMDVLATQAHGVGWPHMEVLRRKFDASYDAEHGPGEALRKRRIAALRARVAQANLGSAA